MNYYESLSTLHKTYNKEITQEISCQLIPSNEWNKLILIQMNKTSLKEKVGLVWIICLMAYQLFIGQLMSKFDSFVNIW